jgi:phosphoglycerate kinase
VENCVKSPNVKSGQSGEKVPNLRLLENLRFWNGETESEPGFAKLLASFGDLYVNESFAAYHASASVTALPHLLPTYFGLQFVNEVQTISKVLQNPKRPIVVVLGGAKADKLEFLPQLLELADQVLLGGLLPTLVKVHDKKLVLGDLDSTSKDLSPVSSELFSQLIMEAGTVIWNGPVGKFEDKSHAAGTRAVAEAMAASTAFTLVGGGDTQAALEELGLEAKIDHLSTGGGALMALLATGTLPAIQAGSGLYS